MALLNNIHCTDCIAFLDAIPDKSVDLAVVDPPYNMQKAAWDSFESDKDFYRFTFSWIDPLITKLKTEGSLYIFNTPYNSAFILCYLIKKEMKFQNWITWDKRDGIGNNRNRFNRRQETILFCSRGNRPVFNCNDVRVPYESTTRMAHAKKKGILKNGKRWFPNVNGRLCGDVWHMTSDRHKNKVDGKTTKIDHATPKPLDLIERIIKASSNENDTVLDCFVGTGTTAVAAKKLRRNFLCCDENEAYVNLAKKRLSYIKPEDKKCLKLCSPF